MITLYRREGFQTEPERTMANSRDTSSEKIGEIPAEDYFDPSLLKKAFILCLTKLVDDVKADIYSDHLIQDGILDTREWSEIDAIVKSRGEVNAARALIITICSKQNGCHKMMELFEKPGINQPHLRDAVVEAYKTISDTVYLTLPLTSCNNDVEFLLSDDMARKVLIMRDVFLEDMSVSQQLLQLLLDYDVVTNEEVTAMTTLVSRRERVGFLLDHIRKKGDAAILSFLVVISQDASSSALLTKLEGQSGSETREDQNATGACNPVGALTGTLEGKLKKYIDIEVKLEVRNKPRSEMCGNPKHSQLPLLTKEMVLNSPVFKQAYDALLNHDCVLLKKTMHGKLFLHLAALSFNSYKSVDASSYLWKEASVIFDEALAHVRAIENFQKCGNHEVVATVHQVQIRNFPSKAVQAEVEGKLATTKTEQDRKPQTRNLIPKPERSPEFVYDVYLAGSSDDTAFMLPLLAELEDVHGFRCLYHLRDFMPGMAITENIATALDNSASVIFILSEAFARSDWCRYELNMAQLIVHKGVQVIPVLLNMVDMSLPNSLKHLTFLDAQRPNFMEKLVSALTKRQGLIPRKESIYQRLKGKLGWK